MTMVLLERPISPGRRVMEKTLFAAGCIAFVCVLASLLLGINKQLLDDESMLLSIPSSQVVLSLAQKVSSDASSNVQNGEDALDGAWQFFNQSSKLQVKASRLQAQENEVKQEALRFRMQAMQKHLQAQSREVSAKAAVKEALRLAKRSKQLASKAKKLHSSILALKANIGSDSDAVKNARKHAENSLMALRKVMGLQDSAERKLSADKKVLAETSAPRVTTAAENSISSNSTSRSAAISSSGSETSPGKASAKTGSSPESADGSSAASKSMGSRSSSSGSSTVANAMKSHVVLANSATKGMQLASASASHNGQIQSAAASKSAGEQDVRNTHWANHASSFLGDREAAASAFQANYDGPPRSDFD